MSWYEQLWANFLEKIWHAPTSLDDIYAQLAFLAAIGTVIGGIQWIVRRTPILLVGALLMWKLPTAMRLHYQSVEMYADAAELLNGGVLRAQAFTFRYQHRAILLYAIAIVSMLVGVLPADVPIWGRYAFMIFGAFVFTTTQARLHRKIDALEMAAKAMTMDMKAAEEGAAKLEAQLGNPIAATGPFKLIIPAYNRSRAKVVSAQRVYMSAAQSARARK